ncbi:tRNA (guanosine(37)-N1)-methyltransferase TrmD [soil metagenome]
MRFDILTIFPGFLDSPLDYGVLKRARVAGQVEVVSHDLRSFTHDRHKTVDGRPFGGGEGMVLKADPIFEAFESLGMASKAERDTTRETVILLSAQGRRFSQAVAHELAGMERVVILCGRYEGVDERVNEMLCDQEISIGDYVLSGGELAAAVIVDAVVRLLPGVLGNPDSARFESFGADEVAEERMTVDGVPRSTHGSGGLLDYPHYTRPAEFRGVPIPEALMSGNHEIIKQWRRRMSLEKTLRNRPDLLEKAVLTAEDQRVLRKLRAKLADKERDAAELDLVGESGLMRGRFGSGTE